MIQLKPIDLKFLSEENGKPCHIHVLNGQRVPGCTSISGLFQDDGWKFAWPVKLMAEEVIREVNERIMDQADEGLCMGQIEPICAKAKNAWRRKRDTAADTGTTAHSLIQNWIETKTWVPADLPTDVMNPLLEFQKWERAYRPKWEGSEVHVGSETYMFAGILDALAKIDGTVMLLDFKTSKSIKDDYAIQLAGLCICLEEMGLVVDGRAILHLPKEGEYEYRPIESNLDLDRRAFLAGLEFYNQKNLFMARCKKEAQM